MLRDPESILRMVHRADIVDPAALQFELSNCANNSNRVPWVYPRCRIRNRLHEVADFKHSGRKQLKRRRQGCRGCEYIMSGEIYEIEIEDGAYLPFPERVAAFSLIYQPPWLLFLRHKLSSFEYGQPAKNIWKFKGYLCDKNQSKLILIHQ